MDAAGPGLEHTSKAPELADQPGAFRLPEMCSDGS
jgi:hypothetical protein